MTHGLTIIISITYLSEKIDISIWYGKCKMGGGGGTSSSVSLTESGNKWVAGDVICRIGVEIIFTTIS